MSKANPRVAVNCDGQLFVSVAMSLSATEEEAQLMWQRLVNRAKNARLTQAEAMSERVGLRELSEIVAAGSGQLPGLKPGEWEIALTTVGALSAPGGRGSGPSWVL